MDVAAKNFREVEARFLNVDVGALLERLKAAGAEDLGEDLIHEVIFYDKDLRWQREEKKYARVRKTKNGIRMTFKHNDVLGADGTKEIEIAVDDFDRAAAFLEAIGLVAFREQEKKRHSFKLGEVMVDIDTWPSIPTYVELEGPSEEALKETASRLGLDWNQAVFESARFLIEKYYGIPVSSYRHFTFHTIG
jgi:adenylate cyclase class 2